MALRPTSFVKALADAIRKRATGAVAAPGEPVRKVWLRSGAPSFVETREPELRFTQILVRLGILSRTEAMLVEEEFAVPGKPDESALLASDTFTPAEIRAHGIRVTEERIVALAAADGETWSFAPGEPPAGMPEFSVSGVDVLARAVRGFPPERLQADFPVEPGDRYQLEPTAIGQAGLVMTPEEGAVARALEKGLSWGEAVPASGVAPERAHAALYLLALLGAASWLGGATGAGETAASQLPGFGRGEEMRARGALEITDLLGVAAEAELPVVHRAFIALVEHYDLGLAHQLPEGDREAALGLLDRASDAFLVTTHPSTRTTYLETPPWNREASVAGLATTLTAEKNYLKAGVFLQAGNFLAAEAAMLPALHMSPTDGRFYLRMGIAIYQRARARGTPIPVGATRALEKAIALDPRNYEGWLYLGHVAAAAGEADVARGYYERALHLNPLSEEARRGMGRAGKR